MKSNNIESTLADPLSIPSPNKNGPLLSLSIPLSKESVNALWGVRKTQLLPQLLYEIAINKQLAIEQKALDDNSRTFSRMVAMNFSKNSRSLSRDKSTGERNQKDYPLEIKGFEKISPTDGTEYYVMALDAKQKERRIETPEMWLAFLTRKYGRDKALISFVAIAYKQSFIPLLVATPIHGIGTTFTEDDKKRSLAFGKMLKNNEYDIIKTKKEFKWPPTNNPANPANPEKGGSRKTYRKTRRKSRRVRKTRR